MSERNLSEHATQFSLGQLIGEDARRDAIHIAVAPVVADVQLWPGQPIGPVNGDTSRAQPVLGPTPLGIVDPFLTAPVYPGQRCWMFLLPNTITGLRHEWTHPGFEPATISQADHEVKSRAWLEAKADHLDLTYRALMAAAEQALLGDITVQQGSETWRDGFGDPKEFWHHYQIVTGRSVADSEQTVFCCTC